MNRIGNDVAPRVRLLILSNGDPESERAFSGSLRSLCLALERRGVVHYKANINGFSDPFAKGSLPVRALRKMDRLGLIHHYRWSRMAFLRNSQRARRVAAKHPGFNACLMYGTAFNPRLDVPTYCYLDATSAQVSSARQWEFRRFSDRKARMVVAYQGEVFRMCTGIFPRTQWAANSVLNDYGVPSDKVHVASAGPNYLSVPLPHGPYDRGTILYVGRDFDRKGGPQIVGAFRLIRKRLPNARLVIVGCSPALDEPGIEVVGPISKSASSNTTAKPRCSA